MENGNNIPLSAFIYTSKEVCTSLGIASSTLRSWCLKLEATGYIFKRDKQDDSGSNEGARMFFERDITALRMMKELLDNKHPLDYAVEQISNKYKAMTAPVSDDNAASTHQIAAISERFVIPSEVKEQLLSEFRDIVREEIRQEVRQELAPITERQLQQKENMTVILRTMLEVKQEIAATKSEVKKSWWTRLRGK